MSQQKKFYIIISSLLILSVVLVLGIEIFSLFSLSSVQGNLSEAKYRDKKLTEKNSNLETLKIRYEEIKEDIPRINTALPGEKEASKLLSDLDTLTAESGLRMTLLQSTSFGKKTVVSADKSLLQTVKGAFGYEMPLEVKVEGSYGGFLSFLSRLENYQRMVNVTGVEINKIEETGAAPDLIEVKLKLKAYLKK